MLKLLKRKNLLYRVLSMVLVVAFVISLLPGFAAKADETVSDIYDVSLYKGDKTEDKWTYPTKEGYVFAGWYTDNTYNTIYTETTGNATAKFVDAKVLNVKKQLLPSKTGTTVSVRFMTAVDSVKFQKVVFEVSAGETGREFVLEETTAWSSVIVDGVTDNRTAADVFGTTAAKYFVLHSISGIPRAVFDEVFTATPYWYTQDGTKVQGTSAEFTINDTIYNYAKYTFVDNADVFVSESYQNSTVASATDDTAKDGYALKVQRSGIGGVTIHFDSLNVADYDSIIIRMKKGTNNLYLYANGTDKYVGASTNANYEDIELKSKLDAVELTTLNSLVIKNDISETTAFYIDEIRFVTKTGSINYDKVQYKFANYQDMQVVTNVGSTVTSIAGEAGAKDGFALKVNKPVSQGLVINFNGLTVSDYDKIIMRIKKTGDANLYINANYQDSSNTGSYLGHVAKNTGYQEIDLKQYMDNSSVATLNNIYMQNGFTETFYIDEILFVEKTEEEFKLRYDFKDESDLEIATDKNSAWLKGITADTAANDGYALLCSTGASNESGVDLTFDNVNVTEYEHIYMRIRTTNHVNLRINGTYKTYQNWSAYTTIDLLDYMGEETVLQKVSVDRNVGLDIYIDEIVFEPKVQEELKPGYHFKDESDLEIAAAKNSAWLKGITADTAANDGYALLCSTGVTDQSGVDLTFDNINVAQYEHIYMRIRTTNAVNLRINGTYKTYQNWSAYTTIDLLDYMGEETILQKVSVDRNVGLDIYIDEITFEAKVPTYAALADPLNEGLELSLFAAPSITTLESFQTVRNSGAKTIYLNDWAGYTLDSDTLKNALEYCEQVGLNAYWMTSNDSSVAAADLKDMLSATTDYTQFKAFKGFYAIDEPHKWQMEQWLDSNFDAWNQSKYKNHTYLVNLFVHDICYNQDGSLAHSYDTNVHLDNYWNYVLKDNPNKILMYDYYPMRVQWDETSENVVLGDKTLFYLNRFAQFTKNKREDSTANASDIKLYTFLQNFAPWREAASGTASRKLTSVRDVRFNVAYNLAYGSKGFAGFVYERQSIQETGSTMIEPDGTKNNSYYYVQKVFNELRDWENVYCAFDWMGTMAIDGNATGNGVQDSSHISMLEDNLSVNDIKRINSVETEHDLLVGTFKDKNGYDGFLITSYADPYYATTNNVKVNFNQATKTLIYHNGKLLTNDDKNSCYLLEDGVLDIDIKVGDYLFVIPLA